MALILMNIFLLSEICILYTMCINLVSLSPLCALTPSAPHLWVLFLFLSFVINIP